MKDQTTRPFSRHRYLAVLTVSALALSVLSCAPEGARLATRGDDSLDPGSRRNTVNFLDQQLGESLSVENTDSRRTPTGTLEVWATLRNRTSQPLQIEGRAHFYGDATISDDSTAWQRVHLPPNGIGTYRDSSTTLDGIAYYYIELREGR